MIFDAHVYCFEPADSPAGHPSSPEHLRWVQAAHARHHQPAFRIRDRQPASSRPLAPSDSVNLADLPDVDFRVDHERGRFVWTIDGEDYSKQFFPPNLHNLEFTPGSLIAEMDYADVDKALLHTDPVLGRDSEYLASCVNAYPDRLLSMAPVDEWRILRECDEVIEQLRHAIVNLRLHAIKFITPLAYLTDPQPWDDGCYRPFWQFATSLGVPVFFTLGTGPEGFSPALSKEGHVHGYLGELEILMRWMERYPGTVCGLTHGYPWRLFLEHDRIVLPESVWRPFESRNCHLEVSFPVRLGDILDFPYLEVAPTLEEMVERIGADQLFWGTDMPFQNRFCTYRQSRQHIEKYCGFLRGADLEKIMGGTACRIFGCVPGFA